MEEDFKASVPDPRILIVQVLAVSVLASSFQRIGTLLILVLILDAMLLLSDGWKSFFKSLAEFGIAALLLMLLKQVHIPVVSDIFPLFLFLLMKVYPMYLAARLLVVKASMNEMLCALESWRIPGTILIPLMVIYRYIPTLLREMKLIRESVKMRNLHTGAADALLHPIRCLENYLVPLLNRSEKISDELSAAAICKGLSTGRRRTCMTDVRFGCKDVVYVACMIAVSAGLLLLDRFI